MYRTERERAARRARWQAAALLCFVAGDGVLTYALGGPLWLVPLYVALGVGFATGRIWLARRADPAAATPATPATPATAATPAIPATAATPATAAAPTPAPAPAEPPQARALGYVFVSEPGDDALDAPSRAIAQCCAERGIRLERIVHDRSDAGGERGRPALAWALERIAEGKPPVLVLAHLRDMSPNVANLSPLLRWFEDCGRTLIAVDLGIDTSTEAGRLAAVVIAGVGGWERERLSERTRAGLDAARSRGGGVGRAAVADVPELRERIAAMREEGMTLQAIADRLNEEGVPTLRGGAMWRPSSVQRATGYRRPSANTRGIELPRQGVPKR